MFCNEIVLYMPPPTSANITAQEIKTINLFHSLDQIQQTTIMMIFFLFFTDNRICLETVCIKCQTCILRKIRKKYYDMSSDENANMRETSPASAPITIVYDFP